MSANPRQFRLRYEDPDSYVLIYLICFEPFQDNAHAEIRIDDPNPLLDDIVAAVNSHQHGREPEL